MKYIEKLRAAGYKVRLKGDHVICTWCGKGQPDPQKVRPLLEELKANKEEALRYLQEEAYGRPQVWEKFSDLMALLQSGKAKGLPPLKISSAETVSDAETFLHSYLRDLKYPMSRPLARRQLKAFREVLSEYNPMTLRQVYYQLVARQVIDNCRSEYQRLSNALVKARQEELIPWAWLEDRVRQPQVVSMWGDLPDFLDTVKSAYRKDIWPSQPQYLEVWLEKDALSGIFGRITQEYGVTLVVGRGYNSWSAYKEAVGRFRWQDKPVVILYFGDFDPSGEDILRALKESLDFFGTSPRIEKVALTYDNVIEYKLPPDFTKATDTRSKKFVQRYGDMAVELDALPVSVLREKIRTAIEGNLDLSQLEAIREIQEQEARQLAELIG